MANVKEQEQPIIIKKIKKGGGGHHGGAWKVAYADFVTAMMAFFLLLWLLNVTTEEEKTAISNYFDPTHPKISSAESGSGGVLGGMTMSPTGAMVSTVQPISQPRVQDTTTRGEKKGDEGKGKNNWKYQEDIEAAQDESDVKRLLEKQDLSEEEKQLLEEQLEKIENERFNEAQKQIKMAIENSPQLAGLSDHLLMDITPEGLRIQIIDKDGRSMFPSGSADMYDFMTALIGKVGAVINTMPNHISIRGHTDGVPYPAGATYNNWDLSSDRAQSSRRALVASGYPEGRIETVVGRADRDHLIPEAPLSAQNRRISVVLLRDRLTRKDPASTQDLQEKIQGHGAQPVVPAQPQSVIPQQPTTQPAATETAPPATTKTTTETTPAAQAEEESLPAAPDNTPPLNTNPEQPVDERRRILEFP